MRASDVVTQLAVLLPRFTGALTRNVELESFVRILANPTNVRARCLAEHGLRVGDAVSIVGAKTPISLSSFTRSGTVGTIVTSSDHDRTLKPGGSQSLSKVATVSGASEAEFNGQFVILQVRNRREILVSMPDSGPAAATGSPILEDGESQLRSYESTYSVISANSPTEFEVSHPVTALPNPVGEIEARTKPRITASVTYDRMRSAYTEQKVDDLWLVVVLDDVVASKDRGIRSDAVSNHQRGSTEFRQQVVQPLTLYLFVPASMEIAGRSARDQAEDFFRPLCRSLLFSKFDSGLYAGKQGAIQFDGHGTHDYDSAVYVHRYSFQQVVDLVFEDTVGPDPDVAFRDVDLTIFPEIEGSAATGTASLTAQIDLDDEPL